MTIHQSRNVLINHNSHSNCHTTNNKQHTTHSDNSSRGEEDSEDGNLREFGTICTATACLYSGAVAKNILDPVLHDRHGHFNTVEYCSLFFITSLHVCMGVCVCVLMHSQCLLVNIFVLCIL